MNFTPTELTAATATTRPPAKLNLFLELLARRSDGYHEIDTVMVPIDWCDELTVQRVERAGVELDVDTSEMTVPMGAGDIQDMVPTDDQNLVYRALDRFAQHFRITGGFRCHLRKSIPSGAGMGGASSDAASALRCAALLCGIPLYTRALYEIAASIGSDVPFFMGLNSESDVHSITAARATGRGEVVSPVRLSQQITALVVYPGVAVSTAEVYANSQVPPTPHSATQIIHALETGDLQALAPIMMNRLTEPAKKVAPKINETLESLWRTGLQSCQLTGSGSACFAIARSMHEAERVACRGREWFGPQATVRAARSVQLPVPIDVT